MNPEAPLPGPIAKVVWRRGKDFLRAKWRRSTAAASYQVRLTRYELTLVRAGAKVKKEYTAFPRPWVERTSQSYSLRGDFGAGERYRIQVRGVNIAGFGPTAVSSFTFPCRVVRSRCAVERR